MPVLLPHQPGVADFGGAPRFADDIAHIAVVHATGQPERLGLAIARTLGRRHLGHRGEVGRVKGVFEGKPLPHQRLDPRHAGSRTVEPLQDGIHGTAIRIVRRRARPGIGKIGPGTGKGCGEKKDNGCKQMCDSHRKCANSCIEHCISQPPTPKLVEFFFGLRLTLLPTPNEARRRWIPAILASQRRDSCFS